MVGKRYIMRLGGGVPTLNIGVGGVGVSLRCGWCQSIFLVGADWEGVVVDICSLSVLSGTSSTYICPRPYFGDLHKEITYGHICLTRCHTWGKRTGNKPGIGIGSALHLI